MKTKDKADPAIEVDSNRALHDLKARAGFVPGDTLGMARPNGESVANVTARVERVRFTDEQLKSHFRHGRILQKGRVKLKSPQAANTER